MTTSEWPPLYERPVRPQWGWGIWTALVVVAALEFVIALGALLVINLGNSTTCSETPTMSNVHAGELSLSVALAIGAVPWVIAVVISPRRIPVVVAGVLAVSPLVLGMLAGTSPSFWDNGFCF